VAPVFSLFRGSSLYPIGPAAAQCKMLIFPSGSAVYSPAVESSNCFRFSPENSHGSMYIIKVEPLSDIKPRTPSGAPLADAGKLRTIEPSPILLRSVKEALR